MRVVLKRVMVLMIVPIAACAPVDPTTELAAARRSFAAGEYRTTALQVSNVLRVDPGNAEARILRGRLAQIQGDYGTALAEWRIAIDRGASDTELAFDMAEAALHTGNAVAARDLLHAVEAKYAGDQGYWALRAEVDIRGGSVESATIALSHASALGEPTARVLIAQANLALASHDFPRAETVLDTAAQRFPQDPRVHQARGFFYRRAGRFEDAAGAFTRAAERFGAAGANAAAIPMHLELVQIYLGENETARAAAAASRLAAIAPQSALALYAQALVSYTEGRFDTAADLAQRAAIAQPDTPAIVTLLGAVHLARGNLGQAEQQLRRAVALDPDAATAIKLLAETRLRQQRPQAALEALSPIAEFAMDDTHIGLLSGIASMQSGNVEQGVRYLENAFSVQPGDERNRLALARAYLETGRHAEAGELLRQGFTGSGESQLEAATMRLFAGLRAGNERESDEDAAALVEAFPDDARALTAAAAFELLRDRTDHADELLERAAAADADYPPLRLLLADRLLKQGKADEAEAELVAVVARDPSVGTRLHLVQLYLRTGRLDDAEPLIAAMAGEAPRNPGVLAAQGLLALARGAAAEAISHFAAAYSARPDQISLVVSLARAQLASGAPEQARATLVGALDRFPDSLPLRSALAALELGFGNTDAADVMARELQTRYPREAAGFLIAADVAIARRLYDDAAEEFEQAFAREPGWPVRHRWINALQLAGREPEVLEQYLAAVAAEPDNVIANNNAAWLLLQLGRVDEALPVAERAHRAAPQEAAVLDTLGWVLVSAGRERDAMSYLEQAARLAPETLEIRYHLAVALARSGDAGRARTLLEELLGEPGPFEQRSEAQVLLESL